jgi:hypothetical protein
MSVLRERVWLDDSSGEVPSARLFYAQLLDSMCGFWTHAVGGLSAGRPKLGKIISYFA